MLIKQSLERHTRTVLLTVIVPHEGREGAQWRKYRKASSSLSTVSPAASFAQQAPTDALHRQTTDDMTISDL